MDVRAIDWKYLYSLAYEQTHGLRHHSMEEMEVVAELIADAIEAWQYRVIKMRPDSAPELYRKIDLAMRLVS